LFEKGWRWKSLKEQILEDSVSTSATIGWPGGQKGPRGTWFMNFR